MGLLRFLKSMTDPEMLGDGCIAVQEKLYRRAAAALPDATPHELLAHVWRSRMRLRRNAPKGDLAVLGSLAATRDFACIAPPANARALGLYFIAQERPDIYERVPKFAQELAQLMGPVLAAENGEGAALYAKYNPKPPRPL